MISNLILIIHIMVSNLLFILLIMLCNLIFIRSIMEDLEYNSLRNLI
jgi:hypothetical protein